MRILDIEGAKNEGISMVRGGSNESFELWDCSGDLVYDNCWLSMQADCSAVLVVVSANNTQQLSQVSSYLDWFVRSDKEMPCLIIALDYSNKGEKPTIPGMQ